jgi:hypothetical protein
MRSEHPTTLASDTGIAQRNRATSTDHDSFAARTDLIYALNDAPERFVDDGRQP